LKHSVDQSYQTADVKESSPLTTCFIAVVLNYSADASVYSLLFITEQNVVFELAKKLSL